MNNQYIDPRKHSWASLNATLIGTARTRYKPDERGWQRAYGALWSLFLPANGASEKTQEPLARSRILSLSSEGLQEITGIVAGRTTHGRNGLITSAYCIPNPCCMEYKNAYNGKMKHYRAYACTNFLYSFGEKNRY